MLPIYCTGEAVTYSCLALAAEMRPFGVATEVWVPAAVGAGRRPFVREAVPSWARRLVYRFAGEARVFDVLERRILSSLREGDVVYLWPGMSPTFVESVRAKGHAIVMERINCARGTAKRILDDEYARLGWPVTDGIDEASVALEAQELGLADRVFAPSPGVRASLEDLGIETSHILSTSYGFDPARLVGTSRALPPFDGLTIVFVGYACVRKGVHLLFEAFARAGMNARLVIAGRIAPDIAHAHAEFLARPDVIALGHVSDVGAVYRSADAFVFPSLEEGGPMVTYEAMGAGLPVVVSPMGAGAIARDGLDGYVVPPHDADAFAAALARLADDPTARASLGASAKARALDFTWAKVGARRQAMVESAFGISP